MVASSFLCYGKQNAERNKTFPPNMIQLCTKKYKQDAAQGQPQHCKNRSPAIKVVFMGFYNTEIRNKTKNESLQRIQIIFVCVKKQEKTTPQKDDVFCFISLPRTY